MICRYLFIITLCIVSSCKNKTEKPTINKDLISHFYFVRHAEKDRSNPYEDNPSLTNQGLLRADKLSTILSNANINAVYATNYNRTLQTATPTANKNNLEIIIYKPNKINITNLLKANKNLLVVGHSNTIPQLVNTIIKSDVYNDIEEHNFKNLYHITVKNGKISDHEITSY